MGHSNSTHRGVALVVLALVVAAAVPGVVGGQTASIDECRTIEQSGTYELSGAIEATDVDRCLEIRSDDVVVEGNGHTLASGDRDEGTVGIHVGGSENVQIQNVVVTGWDTGLHAAAADGATISGVTAVENTDGIEIVGSDGVTLNGPTARANTQRGLSLGRGTTNTVVRGGVAADNGADLAVAGGDGNRVRSLSLGESTAPETRVSATPIRNASIRSVESIPDSPDGQQSAGRAAAITALGSDTELSLTLHYEDGDVDDESALSIWSYGAERWATVGGSVDAEQNGVSASIDRSAFPTATTRFAALAGDGSSARQTATETPTATPTSTPVSTEATDAPTDGTEAATPTPADGGEDTTPSDERESTDTAKPTREGDESTAGDGTAVNASADGAADTESTGGERTGTTTSEGGAGESGGVLLYLLAIPLLGLVVGGVVTGGLLVRRSDRVGEWLAGGKKDDESDADEDDDPKAETEDQRTGDAVRGVRDLTNCGDCGEIVGTNERFCSQCGARLDENPDDDPEKPVPTALTLSVGGREIAVRDGTTVDEQLRSLLRDGGKSEQTKWIDDGHLVFQRTDDGFVLTTRGDNLTRVNGERVPPGETAHIAPGDEIEVSGLLALSVRQ
ncbi:right-handed parallel beta-helix repeat-containing protein [Halomicrobium katesii]|uniref:right-handed parallel beta-helix repeat-containing protein n=1 Tax=Halomicrobium katesii TaxID=437163 RepID=UPI0005D29A99|nr:right-handed parallel beta-helix repeat-containing protein [Halomicrobium katesii]